jgi:hypothetical protein
MKIFQTKLMETVIKEKQKHRGSEKSRNGPIIKCSTMIALNKIDRTQTPIKLLNPPRSGRKDAPPTPRERALVNQNAKLKKENSELIKLLKKSQELIKEEVHKSKIENQTLKSLLATVWPTVENKIDEKLKEQIKNAIGIKESIEMSTNDTGHVSGMHASKEKDHDSHSKDQEIASLKQEISSMDLVNTGLETKLRTAQNEIESMGKYLSYISGKVWTNEDYMQVDSANIGSEADEEESKITPHLKLKKMLKQTNKSVKQTNAIPGYVKSIYIKLD